MSWRPPQIQRVEDITFTDLGYMWIPIGQAPLRCLPQDLFVKAVTDESATGLKNSCGMDANHGRENKKRRTGIELPPGPFLAGSFLQ